jgi:tetratricopeptide (TPR) repeat protein
MATVYEPLCLPKLELWLQEMADYKKAKADYKKAKADYLKAGHEAKAEVEKAEAEDQEAIAKYEKARAKFEKAKEERQESSKAEWEKAKAEYKKAKTEYDKVKEEFKKAKAKIEKAKKEAEAEFEKAKAELDKAKVEYEDEDEDEDENGAYIPDDEDEPDRNMPALQVGVDIKLIFSPSTDITDTRSIRLIQFKRPIHQSKNSTSKGWAVDAHSLDIYPYFGWDNENKVRCHGNDHKANMQRFPPRKKRGPGAHKKSNQVRRDIDVRRMLGIRVGFHDYQVESGNRKFVRGLVPELKGKPLAQEGMKSSTTSVNAYIIDTPREMCRGPANALFTTYAYDLSNSKWLGGVSWGYRFSLETDEQYHLEMCGLKKRSGGSPLKGEEGETRGFWMVDAPTGRIPVPPEEDVNASP